MFSTKFVGNSPRYILQMNIYKPFIINEDFLSIVCFYIDQQDQLFFPIILFIKFKASQKKEVKDEQYKD